MPENKPPSPAMMLYEAARFAGFDAAKGWPVELETVALACLMAEEVDCKYGNRADLWLNMLDDAVKAGRLRARAVPLNSDDDEIIIISARSHWYYVTSDAFAAWLHIAGENPNAFVRAWLGKAWQDEAPSGAAPWNTDNESGAGELATTSAVRTAFASAVGKSFDQFKRALEDAPVWIKGARRAPAGKGKSAGYLWDVAVLAEAITEHYKLNRKAMHAAIAAQWPAAADTFAL